MNIEGNLNVEGSVKYKNVSHVGQIIFSETLSTMEQVISIYGGTKWVPIEGKFLLGASSAYPVNTTGGEATHKLTVSEMPTHSHPQQCSKQDPDGLGQFTRWDALSTYKTTRTPFVHGNGLHTYATGGSQAHNNMPPYVAVYMWERTE